MRLRNIRIIKKVMIEGNSLDETHLIDGNRRNPKCYMLVQLDFLAFRVIFEGVKTI